MSQRRSRSSHKSRASRASSRSRSRRSSNSNRRRSSSGLKTQPKDYNTYVVRKAAGEKKFQVTYQGRTIRFGQKGYTDYPHHKDHDKMMHYVKRHGGNSPHYKTSYKENWTKSGSMTPGFWSRWMLWNKPSISASLSDMRRKFGMKIKYLG